MSPEIISGAGDRWLLDPDSPVRRHYESLANNLLSLQGRPRTIVVTAPESGAGRSSVCLGVGAALARMGCRAAVVDCNLRRPHLHQVLGEPNFVGLVSGLDAGKPLEGYGREVVPGLLLLPTGPIPLDPDSCLDSEQFVEAVRELESTREVVLLDAPVVGEMKICQSLIGGFDGSLLVLHGSRTPRKAAREAVNVLLGAGAKVLGVVLNGYATETGEQAEGMIR